MSESRARVCILPSQASLRLSPCASLILSKSRNNVLYLPQVQVSHFFANAMPSAWRILNLPYTDATVPPLLLKYEIGAADYSIWITDLTLMWMESLDRKRIIQRSFSIDTSIDPSEGSDQFRLFLQSLESTLEQRPGTTLDLVQDGGDRKLLLQMCTPLPGSLKPLEWFLELALASQSRLTTELVVPMLGQQVIAKLERASLLQQLKEKDQVVTKLVDKMQSDGVDIGRVFPGIASSKPGKQNSRQALGKVVKGLDEFDEQQWRDRLTRNEISPKEYPDLISSAFKNGLPDLSDSSQIPKYNNWWEVLSHRDSQREVPKQIFDFKEGDENTSQSEFQVRCCFA